MGPAGRQETQPVSAGSDSAGKQPRSGSPPEDRSSRPGEFPALPSRAGVRGPSKKAARRLSAESFRLTSSR